MTTLDLPCIERIEDTHGAVAPLYIKRHHPYPNNPWPHVRVRCGCGCRMVLRIFCEPFGTEDPSKRLSIRGVTGTVGQWRDILLPKLGIEELPYSELVSSLLRVSHEQHARSRENEINPWITITSSFHNERRNFVSVAFEQNPKGDADIDRLKIAGVDGTVHQWCRVFLPIFGMSHL